MTLRRMLHILAAWLLVATAADGAPPDELAITDPVALARLEDAGFAFARRLTAAQYDSLAAVVGADLQEQDDTAARALGSTSIPPETLPPAWLSSPSRRFPLVAVVHRVDRRWLPGSRCGDIRLIYRAAHADGGQTHLLPITMSLVYDARDALVTDGAGCAAMRMPAGESPRAVAAAYLRAASPGRKLAAGTAPLRRVEINAQIGRWLPTADAGFSDQTHYLLRSLAPDARSGRLVPATLENSPDVARLGRDPRLRAELLAFLQSPAARAAEAAGTLLLPPRFLATKALSVSPYGPARLVNRPFSAVFAAAELDAARLRRLDALSCAGCHQSRSMAGFHLLGFERRPEWSALKLARPFSAYYDDVQAWRRLALDGAAFHSKPPPPPERSGAGRLGDTCGLSADLAAWGCGPGLRCDATFTGEHAAPVGRCEHAATPPADGAPCDRVAIASSSAQPLADRHTDAGLEACAGTAFCAPARAGFPGGMCGRPCTESQPGLLCEAIPSLGPFSDCVARTGAVRACAEQHRTPVLVARCAANADCRPDYVCVSNARREGYCAPPYFLPELTLTGVRAH